MIYVLALDHETDTQAFARQMAALLIPGDVILLEGTLGMGKSTFARALIRHIAQNETLEVPSPTFTLIQNYDMASGSISPLWHVDLYRLSSPDEVSELGLEEALETGAILIEWPERLGSITFPQTLTLSLQQGQTPESRVARLRSMDPKWQKRLETLRSPHP